MDSLRLQKHLKLNFFSDLKLNLRNLSSTSFHQHELKPLSFVKLRPNRQSQYYAFFRDLYSTVFLKKPHVLLQILFELLLYMQMLPPSVSLLSLMNDTTPEAYRVDLSKCTQVFTALCICIHRLNLYDFYQNCALQLIVQLQQEEFLLIYAIQLALQRVSLHYFIMLKIWAIINLLRDV